MSQRNEIAHLIVVSEALYEREREGLVRITEQENALRQELARLSDLGRSAPVEPLTGGMRAVGADVIWQGWLGRAQTALNMKLARVLATKEDEQVKVRRAFGKLTALRQLHDQQKAEARKKRLVDQLQKGIDHHLHGG